jgi:hypothetical protein
MALHRSDSQASSLPGAADKHMYLHSHTISSGSRHNVAIFPGIEDNIDFRRVGNEGAHTAQYSVVS